MLYIWLPLLLQIWLTPALVSGWRVPVDRYAVLRAWHVMENCPVLVLDEAPPLWVNGIRILYVTAH